MPIYEYRCSKCGDVFEKLQKFSDAPLQVHEGCGGPVERLISKSGFSLKGSGWYVTDYGKGGSVPKQDSAGDASKAKTDSKPGESKPAESKSTESKSSESKTESKPAAGTTKSD